VQLLVGADEADVDGIAGAAVLRGGDTGRAGERRVARDLAIGLVAANGQIARDGALRFVAWEPTPSGKRDWPLGGPLGAGA